jgi:hypothetical protein
LSVVKSEDDLVREATHAWESIDLTMINNYVGSLKARIWALEDLRGQPLPGHQDMIRAYEQEKALELMQKHEVPEDWADYTQDLVYDLLEDPVIQGGTPEEQQQRIAEFTEAWRAHKSTLPFRRRA